MQKAVEKSPLSAVIESHVEKLTDHVFEQFQKQNLRRRSNSGSSSVRSIHCGSGEATAPEPPSSES
jgi:hypothetical protein